ncbi:MAG: Glycyl-tRNA synthetase [candidate division WS6 bacterium GW2011_GWF2_39_15]|uniref:Glycyl-tRNA synthetase n=1 Tax=candidate division WS6 bacterium GW2011_GWF2_39_15 TaxID=1619100 RepID=A0A0G0MRD0_9BACT|nr:MAG: Glycyl-tRNA synthetase [candidate division WS6 bacterium GW2011_GWF2_39_15]
MEQDLLSKVTSLSKRRGILFPNSEIYGGIGGFYDYGPIGVEMKNNLKRHWWKFMVDDRDDVVGIDGTIITHPKVWEASGHVTGFADEVIECKKCHQRFRPEDIEGKCPKCGSIDFTESRKYNMLFKTEIGVIEGDKVQAYLRGEACQTIYLDFKNVVDSSRVKVPFGIAQIGKAFRNEITPNKFTFRTREFEQWDLQFFVHPDDMAKWFEYWKEQRMSFFKDLYRKSENLRFYQHPKEKLIFYAKDAYDIEYLAPWGWAENEGIHWRSDYDLTQHSKFSGKDLSYTDPITNEKYIPWIVETSGGVDRTFLFMLFDAYEEEKLENGEVRTVLKIKPEIAAYKAAVFPLVGNKEELTGKAREVYESLRKNMKVMWDDRGNIGKRYRYQDEIGTPKCITIDYQTLEDNTVTVRDRDTMEQIRVRIEELESQLKK